ncbi:type I toxin-antitoxin system toxin Ldr family protein [Escherichia coli]
MSAGGVTGDLAAPILAGIITAAIVSWWRNRK